MIPRLDAAALDAGDPEALERLREAAEGVGFFTVHNTALTPETVETVIAEYRRFFELPEASKRAVDMARTGANRGWGAPGSEQVDPEANPDYKQVFDVGRELPVGDPWIARNLAVYAPNQWPEHLPGFRRTVSQYFNAAMDVAMRLLRAIARALGEDPHHFDAAFARPMALLRGNYYPARPDWAGAKDFGIATHTDYGCLTLLATDGAPGLEVRQRGGGWIPLSAPPGEFIVNFGEMLEFWTAGRVKATPHRVEGTRDVRISVPLFFNPSYDTDVAPPGAQAPVSAGEHLAKRFAETYVHLKEAR